MNQVLTGLDKEVMYLYDGESEPIVDGVGYYQFIHLCTSEDTESEAVNQCFIARYCASDPRVFLEYEFDSDPAYMIDAHGDLYSLWGSREPALIALSGTYKMFKIEFSKRPGLRGYGYENLETEDRTRFDFTLSYDAHAKDIQIRKEIEKFSQECFPDHPMMTENVTIYEDTEYRMAELDERFPFMRCLTVMDCNDEVVHRCRFLCLADFGCLK